MQKPEAFPPFWVYAVVLVSAVLYLGALVFWISAPWWFIHTTNPPPGAIELLHARGYTWATIYGAFAITLVFGSLFWLMAYLLYCTILREKGQAPLRPLLVGACLCFILLSMGGVGAVSYFMPRNTQYIVDNTAGVLSKEEHFLLRRSEVRMVKLDQIGHIEYQYHEGGTDATSPIASTRVEIMKKDGTTFHVYDGSEYYSRKLAIAIANATGMPLICYEDRERDCSSFGLYRR